MSLNSIKFNVVQYKIPNESKNYYYSDLIEQLSLLNKNVLICKDFQSYTHTQGVYFNENSLFEIDIVWGRNFSQDDFANNTNTVLVNENKLEYCVKDGEKYYYLFDGYKYEVIGAYKQISNETSFYLNLSSSYLSNNICVGDFTIDIHSETSDDNIDFITKISQSEKNYQNGMKIEVIKEYNSNNFKNFLIMLLISWMNTIISLLPCILLLFNASTIFNFWLLSRKDEIFARVFVGASNKKIKNKIMFEYLCISFCSLIIGMLIFKIMQITNTIQFLDYGMNEYILNGTVITYVILISLLGVLLNKYVLTKFIKKVWGD